MSKKTIGEQITDLEATRAAKMGALNEITEKCVEEGRTKDEAEREQFAELRDEVKAIDDELADLREMEKLTVSKAAPVTEKAGKSPKAASENRSGFITARPNIEKGTAFARYAMALAASRGSVSDAVEFVKGRTGWMDQTPEVVDFIKATAGNTTDADWASALVNETNLQSEFIEILRPATIMGRLEGIRRVPFNVRIPVQTGSSTVNWVGESAPKPVSDLAFSTISLDMDKVAGIVVLTDELVRSSAPSAEGIVRQDLVAQIARFLDAQFLDPAVVGTDDNPASITNGVTPISASGVDAEALYYDMSQALNAFVTSDMGLDSAVWITTPAVAAGISLLRNALGQFEFAGVNMSGGTLMGLPVVVSNSVPAGSIVLAKANEILLADDGGVQLDASREATLDMNGGATPNFNLWQRNCVAIRAERFITWAKRRANAVAVITGAAYGPAAPAAGGGD